MSIKTWGELLSTLSAWLLGCKCQSAGCGTTLVQNEMSLQLLGVFQWNVVHISAVWILMTLVTSLTFPPMQPEGWHFQLIARCPKNYGMDCHLMHMFMSPFTMNDVWISTMLWRIICKTNDISVTAMLCVTRYLHANMQKCKIAPASTIPMNIHVFQNVFLFANIHHDCWINDLPGA